MSTTEPLCDDGGRGPKRASRETADVLEHALFHWNSEYGTTLDQAVWLRWPALIEVTAHTRGGAYLLWIKEHAGHECGTDVVCPPKPEVDLELPLDAMQVSWAEWPAAFAKLEAEHPGSLLYVERDNFYPYRADEGSVTAIYATAPPEPGASAACAEAIVFWCLLPPELQRDLFRNVCPSYGRFDTRPSRCWATFVKSPDTGLWDVCMDTTPDATHWLVTGFHASLDCDGAPTRAEPCASEPPVLALGASPEPPAQLELFAERLYA